MLRSPLKKLATAMLLTTATGFAAAEQSSDFRMMIESAAKSEAAQDMARQGKNKWGEFNELVSPEAQREILAHAHGIGNDAMVDERKEIMDYLGLNDLNSQLYIFISFSMPDEMIKAYLREAMWTGAIVVVRGIEKDKTLKEFLTQRLLPYITNKGGSAAIQIDPRLFDAYAVTAVPSIVYTTIPSRQHCQSSYDIGKLTKGQVSGVLGCEPAPENQYWKITGVVTVGWALEQFDAEGAPGIGEIQNALARLDSSSPTQSIAPFEGSWDSVKTPAEGIEFYKTMMKAGNDIYDTPLGPAVGPQGLDYEEGSTLSLDDLR